MLLHYAIDKNYGQYSTQALVKSPYRSRTGKSQLGSIQVICQSKTSGLSTVSRRGVNPYMSSELHSENGIWIG